MIGLAIVLSLVALFLLITIKPLDRTPTQQKPAYETMMHRLDSITVPTQDHPKGFSVGFGKVNITPDHPTALAGYGNRRGKVYSGVLDSIYVRAIVVDNGVKRVAIVSADLLIIPPEVTTALSRKLPDIGFTLDNTYLGAIHSHNSIGNWSKGAASFLYGSYEEAMVEFIADKIIDCIRIASQQVLPASLKQGAIPISNAVGNRLYDDGGVDSLFRVIEVSRSDSSKLLLMSYTAHATCLFSRNLELSRDYPGKLVDEMEGAGYTFAMYMAGAVGSHRCMPPEFGKSCISWMADVIKDTFMTHRQTMLQPVKDTTLVMLRVALTLPDAEVKVLKDWQVRPWFFKAAFGEYPNYLTALRWGNVVLLGTPCDFSGELTAPLDSLAHLDGLHTMVTSFNGGYIGYITADQYYDREHYETRLMNWYGPGNGDYLTECLLKLTQAVGNGEAPPKAQ